MRVNTDVVHKRHIQVEVGCLMRVPEQIASALLQTFLLMVAC
jgi:hypothetical protein